MNSLILPLCGPVQLEEENQRLQDALVHAGMEACMSNLILC